MSIKLPTAEGLSNGQLRVRKEASEIFSKSNKLGESECIK